MTCKGICSRHQAQKPLGHAGRYASNQKRCQICDIFMKWDSNFCPCCGYRLRTKPRNLKYKAKMNNQEYVKNTIKTTMLLNADGSVETIHHVDNDMNTDLEENSEI